MRADKREAYEQQQREASGEGGGGGGLPFGLKLPEMPKDFDWDAEIELPGEGADRHHPRPRGGRVE